MYEPVASCPLSPGYHCQGLAWSPFNKNQLAVVSGINYGLKGSGRVELLQGGTDGWRLSLVADWPDVVVDVVWSEQVPSVLMIATGDRAVALLNTDLGKVLACNRSHHSAEVSCVAWSPVRGHGGAVSTSWDGTACLWDPRSLVCTRVFPVGGGRVYDAACSPHDDDRFITAAGDGRLSVWCGSVPGGPQLRLSCSPCELLSCDWSRYQQHQVASAGVDGCIRVWDLRRPVRPLCQLTGHTQAIKKVRYSAFSPDLLASVSYDASCRVWSQTEGRCVVVLPGHSEFVYGVDWSVLQRDVLATCGWDGWVRVSVIGAPPFPTLPGNLGSP